MARIRLTLHNVSFFKDLKDQTTSLTDIAISTDKETYRGLVLDGAGGQKVSYQLSLTSLKFQKKMYQPTEITAELHVGMDNDAAMGNNHIQRQTLEGLLVGKKVTLESVGHDGSGEKVETIGDDFFVNDVHPHYTKEAMVVTLKIFSLDKLMTTNQGCNVFVAKKLGAEILEKETKKYALPWDKKQHIAYSAEHMAVLKYDYVGSDPHRRWHPFRPDRQSVTRLEPVS